MARVSAVGRVNGAGRELSAGASAVPIAFSAIARQRAIRACFIHASPAVAARPISPPHLRQTSRRCNLQCGRRYCSLRTLSTSKCEPTHTFGYWRCTWRMRGRWYVPNILRFRSCRSHVCGLRGPSAYPTRDSQRKTFVFRPAPRQMIRPFARYPIGPLLIREDCHWTHSASTARFWS